MTDARVLLCFLSLVSQPALYAQDQDVLLRNSTSRVAAGVGLEYESGDYGTGSVTDLWRVPVSLSYQQGNVLLAATIPYLAAESSGVLVVSGGGGRHARQTLVSGNGSSASGIGDLELSARYSFPVISSGYYRYFVSGQVKVATADENKGLGTGENDYSLSAGFKYNDNAYRYRAALGYEITGDPPGADYRDVIFAYAGAAVYVSSLQEIGLLLDYSAASTRGFDSALQLSGYINHDLSETRYLHGYLLMGLTTGSPDWGLGLNITKVFD